MPVAFSPALLIARARGREGEPMRAACAMPGARNPGEGELGQFTATVKPQVLRATLTLTFVIRKQ